MPKKKKRIARNIKIVLILVLLAALAYLMKLSIDEYQRQTEAAGITICSEEECIKTMHIHSDIRFDLCGETHVLPRETGPLDGLHTHKEKNYLHFHDDVGLEMESKAQLFDKRLSVQEVIDIFELEPNKYCGEAEVEIIVLVNGEPNTLDYNWDDGDEIELIYETK